VDRILPKSNGHFEFPAIPVTVAPALLGPQSEQIQVLRAPWAVDVCCRRELSHQNAPGSIDEPSRNKKSWSLLNQVAGFSAISVYEFRAPAAALSSLKQRPNRTGLRQFEEETRYGALSAEDSTSHALRE